MIPRILTILILACSIVVAAAQEKPKPDKQPTTSVVGKGNAAVVGKDSTVTAPTDTTVSRIALLAFLNDRRQDLTRQMEAQLIQFNGLINGYQFITSDSVKVSKSLFR